MATGFTQRDPAHGGFQFLEDLSTAYWYSQVLFTAIELKLFGFMEQGVCRPGELARTADCDPGKLARLLGAMERISLVTRHGQAYYNNPAASRFLVPGKADYMGDFFLYRRYMRPQWDELTCKLTGKTPEPEAAQPYSRKMLNYTAAMDTLMRQKSPEIRQRLEPEAISGTLLDIGGGAGSLARTLKQLPGITAASVFDLPDTMAAARELYPRPGDWEGLTIVEGDFRTHEFDQTFSLVSMSSFLHAYGPREARTLLFKAAALVQADGWMAVHDYFPDRMGCVPQKGPLYDLNMLVNTYNGVCHKAGQVIQWLSEAGFGHIAVQDLDTDTALILARKQGGLAMPSDLIETFALELGFTDVVPVAPGDVVTAPWAREKCRYGCGKFGKGLQCPPYGMDDGQTRKLLDSYASAYLVRGTPPGKAFHRSLLSLEKKAFLHGCHKAFVFAAGPCSVCEECPDDGKCRFPHLARPSMEGSGIDVYATAANAGITLRPVTEKGAYVTYLGLLLIE